MLTVSRTTYDNLLAEASAKANLLDHSVAIVLWEGQRDNYELVELHTVGNAGEHDMTRVNELLAQHPESEIIEIVGPAT